MAGKTFAIILLLYKYAVLEKNSTIVCFRRNATQLRSGGGIWQEATMVFRKMLGNKVEIRNRDMEIYVPETNSHIKFTHLQYASDVDSHLSAQYSVVLYDEATTFDFDTMILPLMGRLRNANVTYKPFMCWCTNPRYNHGIYHWIKDFYLDDFGIPLENRSNVKRWLVMQNGNPIWYDKLSDAQKIHGKGKDSGILSFRSIRAHVTDNKPLLKANPSYLSNLKALPEIKRRIFLDGSWVAREEEVGLYLRSMSKVVNHPNMKADKRVRAWDLASSPVSTASPNPDWTRGVLVSKQSDLGVYTVEDIVSVRDRPHIVEQLIYRTALEDREKYGRVVYVIPCDPGQAGLSRSSDMKRKLAELGIECQVVRPSTAKRTRFLPFSSIAEAGFVHVVSADWNEEFYNELEEFSGLKRGERDDMVDCCSDAVLVLNKQIQLPSFSLPVLSSESSFGFQDSNFSTGLAATL